MTLPDPQEFIRQRKAKQLAEHPTTSTPPKPTPLKARKKRNTKHTTITPDDEQTTENAPGNGTNNVADTGDGSPDGKTNEQPESPEDKQAGKVAEKEGNSDNKQTGKGDEQEGKVSTAVLSDDPAKPPRVRETRLEASNRWIREGLEAEVRQFRKDVRDESIKRGMSRLDAKNHSWDEAFRVYPPPGVTPADSPKGQNEPLIGAGSANGVEAKTYGIQGIQDLPELWGDLPASVSLRVELTWVQAERLRVIRERPGNQPTVDLSQASTPAPSMGALSWLETSIRSYAKYVDTVARTMGADDDSTQHAQRERVALREVHSLLGEMRPGATLCDECRRRLGF